MINHSGRIYIHEVLAEDGIRLDTQISTEPLSKEEIHIRVLIEAIVVADATTAEEMGILEATFGAATTTTAETMLF